MAGTAGKKSEQQVTTAAAWGGLKAHSVTLQSGAVVKLQVLDLPELVKAGELPNDLVDTAISVAQGTATALTREHIEQQPDLYNFIIQRSVVEPKVDDELYKKIPFEDKELIVELATRQRDVDAVGHHIGGLHTNRDWRKFRGLEPSLPDVEGL